MVAMYRKLHRAYTSSIIIVIEVILMFTTTAYCATSRATVAASTTTTTTTTTTPPPTKAPTLIPPVTTKRPELGSDCTNKEANWCNNKVTPNSVCGTEGKCVCDGTSFMFNSSTCLSIHFLKPVSPRVEQTTSVSMKISWDKALEVSSLPDIAFSVSLAGLDVNLTSLCNLDGLTSVSCMWLIPGHKYNVTVLAKYGTTQQSASITSFTQPSTPGELVTSDVYEAPDVFLRWRNSTGRVEKYIVNIVEINKTIVSVNATPEVTVKGLEPGKKYTVEIKALSHQYIGPTRRGEFETTTNSEFGKPRHLRVEFYNETVVSLGWLEPSEFAGQISEYIIKYKPQIYPDMAPPLWDRAQTKTIYKNSTMITGLISGAYYHFRVYTVKDENRTYAYADTKQKTKESIPGQVKDLKVMSNGPALLVKWERPEKPHGCITHYKVTWNKEETDDPCLGCSYVLKYSKDYTGFCNRSFESITPLEARLSYTIKNFIEENTTYIVSVKAFTNIGGGANSSTNAVTRPNPIHNLAAINITTTSLTVTWTMKAGDIFKFFVCLRDLVFHSNNCHFSCETDDTSCEFDGLEEYWNYSVTLHALGSGNFTKEIVNTRTLPSNPGQIENYSIETFESPDMRTCDASIARVTWNSPNITERNSKITFYEISIVGLTVKNRVNEIENQMKKFTIRNILADSDHTIKIRAVSRMSEGVFEGIWYSDIFRTGICAPPVWPSSVMKLESATPSGVTIVLEASFFRNDAQGKIIRKGLIVSREEEVYDSVFEIGSYSSSKSKNFLKPYRIDLTGPMDKEIEKISIGDDSGCRSLQPHCNGPLPEQFSFNVTAFACTGTSENLCRTSQGFGPFKTSQKVPEENNLTALVVVSVVLLIAVIFLACVVLWRKGLIDPTRIFSKPEEIEQPLENKRECYTEIQRKRPIMLSEFDIVLSELHRDSNLKFSDQYEDILKLSKMIENKSKFDEAVKEENKPKNRWVNILPFDHSRVKLQQLDDDDPSTDYINANYIPGYNHKREYIATQGPLPGTVEDFWRMVWEQNAAVIVMLTKCKEGNRVKCEQYWPTELREPKQYWNVVVNLISISTLDKFNLSIFTLTMNKEKRQVMHFHYQDFPDFSANVEMDNFIEFTRTVRNHVPHELRGPIIVHCSAGVGRSGTYIAIDRLLQFLNDPDFSLDLYVDIFDIVMSMRENRVTMVQTEGQYVMVFDCFHKMLEDKKREMLANVSMDSDDKLYANQGFEPYPEVVYENITNRDVHHLQLGDDEAEELQTAL